MVDLVVSWDDDPSAPVERVTWPGMARFPIAGDFIEWDGDLQYISSVIWEWRGGVIRCRLVLELEPPFGEDD